MQDRNAGRVRLPQLGALKVFETVARHESLVRAAEELCVTHGAVSKQIKALEAELGEVLFVRRNRGVVLTERGRRLAGQVHAAFVELEDALAVFRERRLADPLVVSCEPTLCLKLLIPLLGALQQETGVVLRVLAAGGRIDFRRDHVDLAIRRNDFPLEATLYSRVLGPEAMAPVCAPAKLDAARQGLLPVLQTKSRPEAWEVWQRLSGAKPAKGERIIYEHFYQALEAAMAGQGVALASIHMVQRDIAEQRLCKLADFIPDGTHYVALSPHPFEGDERMMRLLPWLTEKMQEALPA